MSPNQARLMRRARAGPSQWRRSSRHAETATAASDTRTRAIRTVPSMPNHDDDAATNTPAPTTSVPTSRASGSRGSISGTDVAGATTSSSTIADPRIEGARR